MIKEFKKTSAIIIFVLAFIALFLLTSCDNWRHYSYSSLSGSVEKVELINYDYHSEKNEKPSLTFDFDKMEIIETLPYEKADEFLKKLDGQKLIRPLIHKDSSQGISIRIVYKNGDFDVISFKDNQVVYKYNELGNQIEYIGYGFDMEAFISKYAEFFETKF